MKNISTWSDLPMHSDWSNQESLMAVVTVLYLGIVEIQLFVANVITFMLYYGLFSCDLHILDLWWRSPLCSLLFVDITPVCTTLLCVHNMASQWIMTLPGTSFAMYY